ncbi:MAG: hypothetical protein GY861_28265 [bacterium]|nr:hypothetical protein [bacterium]
MRVTIGVHPESNIAKTLVENLPDADFNFDIDNYGVVSVHKLQEENAKLTHEDDTIHNLKDEVSRLKDELRIKNDMNDNQSGIIRDLKKKLAAANIHVCPMLAAT